LKPREAVLEYVIPYHRSHPAFDLYILLLTPTSAKSVHVALNEVLPFNVPMIGTMMIGKEVTEYSQLSETVVQTRIAIQTGDEKAAQRSLRDLYKILIQPLIVQGVRLADFDHLVIVPHGPLHYVPFAALLDGDGKYLISKTALTVVPSASVWLALTRRSGSVERFVGFGNPDLGNPKAGELKYAAQEMVDIPKILTSAGSTVFVGPDATADRFEQEAPSANVLHVSTHGEFPDEDAIGPAAHP
jgi:CHAT domain-containing protein